MASIALELTDDSRAYGIAGLNMDTNVHEYHLVMDTPSQRFFLSITVPSLAVARDLRRAIDRIIVGLEAETMAALVAVATGD